MPIRRFIDDGEVLDPVTLQSMNTALLGACKALGVKVTDDYTTRLLAARILKLARAGEHNPERLRAAALRALHQMPPG